MIDFIFILKMASDFKVAYNIQYENKKKDTKREFLIQT